MPTPTESLYKEIENAYDFFNEHLFSGKLPAVVLTLQRERNTLGHVAKKRFLNKNKEHYHELALNPQYFASQSVKDVFSTLVHEQAHIWQIEYGKPGRGGYHNKEWARKMESLGLIPSHTSQPGGKKTGDKMSHYINDNGLYQDYVQQYLSDDGSLSWADRFPKSVPGKNDNLKSESDEILEPESDFDITTDSDNDDTEKKKKIKYTHYCSDSPVNVWGKPNLNLLCGDCGEALNAVSN